MFNALKYTQDLEKAGFTSDQAKASLNLLIDVMNESFATKADLTEVRTMLQAEIHEVRTVLQAEIHEVRTVLRAEIQGVKSELQAEMQTLRADIKALDYKIDYKVDQLRSDLTIRLGSMMAVSMGLLATLIKLL